MGIKEGSHEFNLVHGIDYKLQGQSETALMVELKEPAMEHIKYYLRLKQMIVMSQMELAKQAGEIKKAQQAVGDIVKPIDELVDEIEDDTDSIHEMLILSLHASDKIDIGAFITTFQKLVCKHNKKSICLIDGKTAMTDAIWNTLHPDDAFDMAVRWCSFFGMPSIEGQKTTLDQPLESPTELMEA